ncbi:MAG: UDP-N-acetylglucosamine 2-epimerase (non-hydrolyzing) [Polyangiaceae bacterium]
MKVVHVVGARPNFMKVAPVIEAIRGSLRFDQRLVHTGQHYDANMSDVFISELGIPAPTENLNVGSGSHAQQTAEVMLRFEKVIRDDRPDLVVVYGDVNSTVAAALVCAKELIPVAHVEAGLRSGDRRMPEEVNRLLTDQLATLLLTPSADADRNLLKEGRPADAIHFVGNVMIDTLVRSLPHARRPGFDLPNRYVLVTLHRPSNVDETGSLSVLLDALADIGQSVPVVFPVHPRTRRQLDEIGFRGSSAVRLVDPVGYLEFLFLQKHASVVVTDSGGIQEETTFLGVPCVTMRETTERPVTVDVGTNVLSGRDVAKMRTHVERAVAGSWKQGSVPERWDGHASDRIVSVLREWAARH